MNLVQVQATGVGGTMTFGQSEVRHSHFRIAAGSSSLMFALSFFKKALSQ